MMMIERIESELAPFRTKLQEHPVYSAIDTIEDIRLFMEQHVFAVWDFMSLLKQLQNELTCTSIPWQPSGNPAAARLINEIVWGEESDVNKNGVAMSHYEMYIEAMQSLGASTKGIEFLLQEINSGKSIRNAIESSEIPSPIADFLNFTFEVVNTKKAHIISAVFTFGREDLIPDMFIEIVKKLSDSDEIKADNLVYYLERHIEIDADEHGPMALKMIEELCGDDETKWKEAEIASKKALEMRIKLWNYIENKIN